MHGPVTSQVIIQKWCQSVQVICRPCSYIPHERNHSPVRVYKLETDVWRLSPPFPLQSFIGMNRHEQGHCGNSLWDRHSTINLTIIYTYNYIYKDVGTSVFDNHNASIQHVCNAASLTWHTISIHYPSIHMSLVTYIIPLWTFRMFSLCVLFTAPASRSLMGSHHTQSGVILKINAFHSNWVFDFWNPNACCLSAFSVP